MPTGHRIRQSIWVDRLSTEAFDAWTDIDAIPRFTPGVVRVVRESRRRTRWTLRAVGLPASTIIEVDDVTPGRMLSFTSLCGRLSGEVSFNQVNATTTAVSVDALYCPTNAAEQVVATIGLPSGRARRMLVRFKNWVESELARASET